MAPVRRARGFTLIEAMIVVAIVGILAVLSVVAYHNWVRTAYIAEAHDMISNIRAAEEAYRAENGTYLKVSNGLDKLSLYPAAPPGAFKTLWGGACTTCANGVNGWSTLNIEAKAPVAFGYAVIGGDASVTPPSSITVNGATVSLANLAGAPWYVVDAMGDINGNGVFTTVYGFSGGGPLMTDHEGE